MLDILMESGEFLRAASICNFQKHLWDKFSFEKRSGLCIDLLSRVVGLCIDLLYMSWKNLQWIPMNVCWDFS